MADLLWITVISAHLLFVGLAMCLPLAAIWTHVFAARGSDPAAKVLGRVLCKEAVIFLLVGILAGSGLLAWRYWQPEGPYQQAMAAVPMGRYWFGLVELVFSLACLMACDWLWDRSLSPDDPRRGRKGWLVRILAFVGATNLIYHFPALFSAISVASTRPEWWDGPWSYAELTRALFDPQVVARWVHVTLSGFVSVFSLLVISATSLVLRTERRLSKQSPAGKPLAADSPADALAPTQADIGAVGNASQAPGMSAAQAALQSDDQAKAVSGRRWAKSAALAALFCCGLQVFSGLWVLMTLSNAERSLVLGGELTVALPLGAGIVLMVALMYQLMLSALGDLSRASTRRMMLFLWLLLWMMTAARYEARQFMWAEITRQPENRAAAER